MFPDIFCLTYFIIIDDSETFSPFCGFGGNLLCANKEILKLIKLPKDITEIGLNAKNKFTKRLNINTSHVIFPVKYSSFIDSKFEFPCIFPVAIYDKTRFPRIPSKIAELRNVPLLVEINQKIDDCDFMNFFSKRVRLLQKNNEAEIPYELIRNFDNPIENNSKNEIVHKKIQLHGTISFLINVLENNGFEFINKDKFSPTISQYKYYKNIWEVNSFIKNLLEKDKNKTRNSIDCIFTSAPLYTRHLLRDAFNKYSDPKIQKVFKHITNQTCYINDYEGDDLELLIPALQLRQEEIKLYYLCLYLIFEKYFCPIIRLPQGVQTDVQAEIDALLNSRQEKRAQSYIKLIEKEQKYCRDFTNFINTFKKIPSVKIYSDGPVEFIRDKKNNLPILISTSLCKIPTTPGNTFFNSVSTDLDLYVHYDELFEILIIRSFNEDDANKYILENCINDFFKNVGLQHIHYFIEDVHDCKSVIDVLKKHSNAKIAIFDCHGQQAKKDIYGNLVIGKEAFNIWEYVQKSEYFPVPPIVMFSTCNTHPLGNNFNSIANGFLAAGVKTIIGTNSPVDSLESGIFIARILYRIDELLPKLIRRYKTTTWLEFISDFFRMSYITDITRYFNETGSLKESDLIKIRTYENFLINSKDVNWYKNFIIQLSEKIEKSPKDCESIINKEIGFTETMKYIILGNADSIIIHGD